jgi:hypothetical protein
LPEKVYPKIKYLDASSRFQFNPEHFTEIFPNLEFLKVQQSHIEITESFFINVLTGLKHLKKLYLKILIQYCELNSDQVLECFQEYGKHLEEVNIVFGHLEYFAYAIEKRPGGSFCLKYRNITFANSWMQKMFYDTNYIIRFVTLFRKSYNTFAQIYDFYNFP